MSGSDAEREHELAELLREVRALRATLDQLQGSQHAQPGLPPDYAVLARTRPELAPDYAVLVRSQQSFFPPDYAVLVRSQPSFFPPEYEVLVRPAIPGDEQSEASEQ
jgi:hypothetical protein